MLQYTMSPSRIFGKTIAASLTYPQAESKGKRDISVDPNSNGSNIWETDLH